ncbi:MAG TPA: hypothetical protein VGN57_10780 [Pirellulaceae bacterium]|jgi:hypothetical protein|nr:hypothetical protein [Pirellulaceae bacterium]
MANFWRFPRVRSWEHRAYDEAFRGILDSLDVPLSKSKPYLSLRRSWLHKVRLYKELGLIPEDDEGERQLAMCCPIGVAERRQKFMTCEYLPCPSCYARRFLRKTCKLIYDRFGTDRRTYRLSWHSDAVPIVGRRPRWGRRFEDAEAGVVLALPIPRSEELRVRIILINQEEGDLVRTRKALAEFVGQAFAYPDEYFDVRRLGLFDASNGTRSLFLREKTRWFSTFGSLWGADAKEEE